MGSGNSRRQAAAAANHNPNVPPQIIMEMARQHQQQFRPAFAPMPCVSPISPGFSPIPCASPVVPAFGGLPLRAPLPLPPFGPSLNAGPHVPFLPPIPHQQFIPPPMSFAQPHLGPAPGFGPGCFDGHGPIGEPLPHFSLPPPFPPQPFPPQQVHFSAPPPPLPLPPAPVQHFNPGPSAHFSAPLPSLPPPPPPPQQHFAPPPAHFNPGPSSFEANSAIGPCGTQYHPPAPVYKHVSTEIHYTNNNDFIPGVQPNFHPLRQAPALLPPPALPLPQSSPQSHFVNNFSAITSNPFNFSQQHPVQSLPHFNQFNSAALSTRFGPSQPFQQYNNGSNFYNSNPFGSFGASAGIAASASAAPAPSSYPPLPISDSSAFGASNASYEGSSSAYPQYNYSSAYPGAMSTTIGPSSAQLNQPPLAPTITSSQNLSSAVTAPTQTAPSSRPSLPGPPKQIVVYRPSIHKSSKRFTVVA